MNMLAEKASRLQLVASQARDVSRSEWLWSAPALLAGAYVVLTPLLSMLIPWTWVGGIYDTKRLLEIGLLLVGAFCAAGVPLARASWLATFRALPAATRWGLGAVGVLGIASALVAPVPRYGLLEVSHLALLFSLGLVVASVCRAFPRRYVQGLLAVMGAGAGLYVVFVFALGYVQHVTDTLGAQLWPGGKIGYSNRRFFNHVQAWALPLLVALALVPSLRCVKGMRAGVFVVASCWWMLLFASNGSGILLSMIVALVGVALVFRKTAWPWVRWQLAAGAAGGVLYGLLFHVIATDSSSLAKRAASKASKLETKDELGRLINWRHAIEGLMQEPWLGLGPMHTAYYPNQLWRTTHNAVIQFFVEWGVVAGALLLGLALWGLWAWCSQSRRRVDEGTSANGAPVGEEPLLEVARIALTGSLLAAGANTMVSGVIVTPASQVMMVLVLGGALGLHLPRHAPSASVSISGAQWALVAFLMVGAGVLAWAAAPDAFSLSERVAAWIFKEDTLWLQPRYWGQGAFGL